LLSREKQRLSVEVQKPLPLKYRGQVLDTSFRVDLVVDDAVLIELKSVERLDPIHSAQAITWPPRRAPHQLQLDPPPRRPAPLHRAISQPQQTSHPPFLPVGLAFFSAQLARRAGLLLLLCRA